MKKEGCLTTGVIYEFFRQGDNYGAAENVIEHLKQCKECSQNAAIVSLTVFLLAKPAPTKDCVTVKIIAQYTSNDLSHAEQLRVERHVHGSGEERRCGRCHWLLVGGEMSLLPAT